MSGIELAGLVLGAIPVVVAGLESYIKGVATIKRYFKYKNELKSLRTSLTTEYDIFRNSCEELLEGLVQTQQMALLLTNPGGALWKDPAIEKRLRRRLQDAYSGYLETVDDMELAIEEFKRRLKLKDGKVQFDDVSAFKQEYKRLKFSLDKSAYEDLMVRIRQDNQTLSRLTKQSLRLEVSRVKRYRHVPDFKGVRYCAKSVFETLSSGWKCSCEGPHTANLRLESRIEDVESDPEKHGLAMEQPRFRIVFSYSHASLVSASTPWSWEEADIRLLKEKQNHYTSNGPKSVPAPNEKKGVRFQDQAEAAVIKALDKQPDLEPIKDLCRAIQTLQQTQREQCLGFLVDEITRQKHGIYRLKRPSVDKEKWSAVSLQNLIPQKSTMQHRFTRGDKLRLAVILASSVLQLYETPWLEKTWQRDDIMFIHSANGPLYEQPFVSRSFSMNKSTQQPRITSKPSMMPAIRNPVLFALGVLLIELCLGKPLEELKRPDERTRDGSVDAVLDWVAADRLVEDVYMEGGSRYGDAVRHCIRCDFDRRETSLEDEDFQQAVYEGVVSLLEDDLKQFHHL